MLKSLLLFLLNLFKTNAQLRLENIILRKQIEILQRTNPKLKINKSDRLLFSIMKDLLSSWKEKLFIVKPETVIKWHRTAFRSSVMFYYNQDMNEFEINSRHCKKVNRYDLF